MNKEARVSGIYNQSDDGFEQEPESSGGGLRKQLEAALAREKKLHELLNKDREKAAGDLLKDKGIDPAVLALNTDGTDPVEWVEKNAHLLGARETVTVETPIDEPAVVVAPDDDPALVAEREALAAMQDAAESGSQAAVSSDLLEKIRKADTEEEFMSLLRENGGLTS